MTVARRHRPKTLLAVLPLTTALAGAAAVVFVPVGILLLASIVTLSPRGLPFLVMLLPWLLIGAVVTAAFGPAAGALAGLPDWLLRRRAEPRLLGAVSAVVVLTAVVSGGWVLVSTTVLDSLLPLPLGIQVPLVTVGSAVLTTVVVVASKRRTQPDAPAARAEPEQPAGAAPAE
ncbi:hypothetical protein ACPEEZ_06210 [Frigoribacterium sp. 2-23]|uniref:hypothetical protein n=1 Tax=Frigoribacterium sp. 2-23 TaxID=3415006 RepID=UPI003C6F6FDD